MRKKILSVIMLILLTLTLFGCKNKDVVVHKPIDEKKAVGTVSIELHVDPEYLSDGYMICLYDAYTNKTVQRFYLFSDTNYTETREVPVGRYTIDVATYGGNYGYPLDLTEDYLVVVKENEHTEMVINAVDPKADITPTQDESRKFAISMNVEFKRDLEKTCAIKLCSDMCANDFLVFDISAENDWYTGSVEAPIGDYTISIHEKLEDGTLGKAMDYFGENVISVREGGINSWTGYPKDENLLNGIIPVKIAEDAESGVVFVSIDVPDGFVEDIILQIYRFSDGQIIDIPLSEENLYCANVVLSAEEYNVYAVLAEKDGEWKEDRIFSTNWSFTVYENETSPVHIGHGTIIDPDDEDDEKDDEKDDDIKDKASVLVVPSTREEIRERIKLMFGEDEEMSDEELEEWYQIGCLDADERNLACLTEIIRDSMSDQFVYDAIFMYQCNGNVDSYVVGENGEPYYVDGNVRGVTLTFQPEKIGFNKYGFKLSEGIINKFVRDDGAKYINEDTVLISPNRADVEPMHMMDPNYKERGQIGTMVSDKENRSYLYEDIERMIGAESIELYSNEYMNSEYTVFIAFGSKITVHGEWNGSNLK